jgi:predicted secreted protein
MNSHLIVTRCDYNPDHVVVTLEDDWEMDAIRCSCALALETGDFNYIASVPCPLLPVTEMPRPYISTATLMALNEYISIPF